MLMEEVQFKEAWLSVSWYLGILVSWYLGILVSSYLCILMPQNNAHGRGAI